MCGEVCSILKEPVERWRNLRGHNLLQLMYQGRKTPSVNNIVTNANLFIYPGLFLFCWIRTYKDWHPGFLRQKIFSTAI